MLTATCAHAAAPLPGFATPGVSAHLAALPRAPALCQRPSALPRSTRAGRRLPGAAPRIALTMSAARGDACLAAAAKALGGGDLVAAQENLDSARMEYIRAGVEDRNELVEEIRARVVSAMGRGPPSPRPPSPKAASPAAEFAQRMRLSKQEGDSVMAEAAKQLSQKEFETARALALKARELFQQAGSEIAREREPMVSNLISYITIEEERDALAKRRKAQKEREEQQLRELERRLEGVAMAAMGDLPVAASAKETPAPADAPAPPALPDVCIVVDNGSSRAASTLALRGICDKLSAAIGMPVVAASLAHADRAPAAELDGQKVACPSVPPAHADARCVRLAPRLRLYMSWHVI